jgi:hypothetical protein
MKRLLKGLMVLSLVGVLLLGITAVAGASGPQVWQLDSESVGSDYQMERTTGPGDDGQSGSVSIASSGSAMWVADEKAVTDVSWVSGIWVAEIVTDSDWGTDADDFTAEVGEWDGSNFTAFTTSTVYKSYVSGIKNIIDLELQSGSETVHKDNWLALKITNSDGSAHTVYTGEIEEASCLRSPQTDPGYPTPELPTVILFGVGLLGLVAYLGVKTHKVLA